MRSKFVDKKENNSSFANTQKSHRKAHQSEAGPTCRAEILNNFSDRPNALVATKGSNRLLLFKHAKIRRFVSSLDCSVCHKQQQGVFFSPDVFGVFRDHGRLVNIAFFGEQTMCKLPPSSPTGRSSRRTKLLVKASLNRKFVPVGTIPSNQNLSFSSPTKIFSSDPASQFTSLSEKEQERVGFVGKLLFILFD